MIVIPFKYLWKIYFFLKLQGHGLKFELATPYSVLNFLSLFDRSSFLSHAIEISKNGKDIIWTSLKNVLFSKITRAWFKNWACHALFNFELWKLEMSVTGSFLSHTPVILENCAFFVVVEMILLTFFDNPNQKSLIWRFQFAVPEHSPHP